MLDVGRPQILLLSSGPHRKETYFVESSSSAYNSLKQKPTTTLESEAHDNTIIKAAPSYH
jgi:hypothetical protein